MTAETQPRHDPRTLTSCPTCKRTATMPRARTVKELRAFLDDVESLWTDHDTKVRGKFEDQPVNVPYHDGDVATGYGPADILYDITGLGIIIEQPSYFE